MRRFSAALLAAVLLLTAAGCGRRTDTWKWVPQRKPLVSCAAHRYRLKHWNGSRTGWYKQKHRPCPIGQKPVF